MQDLAKSGRTRIREAPLGEKCFVAAANPALVTFRDWLVEEASRT